MREFDIFLSRFPLSSALSLLMKRESEKGNELNNGRDWWQQMETGKRISFYQFIKHDTSALKKYEVSLINEKKKLKKKQYEKEKDFLFSVR